MEGEAEVKVLGNSLSAFHFRVCIALNQKGVPYQFISQDLRNKGQLLLESNPIHKTVPVLLHNGHPICESSMIVEYIDETWPSPPLFNPSTPYNRAMHRFWVHFIDNQFVDACRRIILSPPGEVQDGAVKDFVESYRILEKAMEDMACGRPFFGGESIGFVDVALIPFICWFKAFETVGKFKLPGEVECPLLIAWANKVLEVPSVKKALPDPNKIVEFIEDLRSKMFD